MLENNRERLRNTQIRPIRPIRIRVKLNFSYHTTVSIKYQSYKINANHTTFIHSYHWIPICYIQRQHRTCFRQLSSGAQKTTGSFFKIRALILLHAQQQSCAGIHLWDSRTTTSNNPNHSMSKPLQEYFWLKILSFHRWQKVNGTWEWMNL